jgi:predicted nuclease of predicted toxin-antitoxin system
VSRIWFTDRDLGKQFPRILADAGIAVERHGDLFPPDGSDEQWLEYCGANGRVAITHNSRIRYVPTELAAVVRFKVPLVIVVGKVPTAELAYNFVRTLHRIESMLDSHAPPLILKVYRAAASELANAKDASGRAEIWFPKP